MMNNPNYLESEITDFLNEVNADISLELAVREELKNKSLIQALQILDQLRIAFSKPYSNK